MGALTATNGLALEVVHPRRGGRWPGRWRAADGSRVYGLFDPSSNAVEVVDPRHDPELPALGRWMEAGRLQAYRPTRRAVVRVAGGERYVKVVRPKRAAAIVHRHAVLEGERARAAPGFPGAAPVLEWSDEEGVIVLGGVAGPSLHDLLRSGGTEAATALERVARGLAAFHRCTPSDPDLRVSEGRTLAKWVAYIERVVEAAELGAYVAALDQLAPLPAGGGLIHGDLHDRNLVLTPGPGVAFLDLDSLGLGHPAEDVGNLAAHIVLRSLQRLGDAAPGRRLAGSFEHAYVASGGPAGEPVTVLARRRVLFRLACVYAARPRWRSLCPALLAEARA